MIAQSTTALSTAYFTIPGKAVGKNQAYWSPPRGSGRGDRVLTSDGKEFKLRVAQIGLGMRPPEWPKNLLVPKRVRVTVAMFGSRHDSGACMQLVKDALEGVYYHNDRVVEQGPDLPADPYSDPRVEVKVELLSIRVGSEIPILRGPNGMRLL